MIEAAQIDAGVVKVFFFFKDRQERKARISIYLVIALAGDCVCRNNP